MGFGGGYTGGGSVGGGCGGGGYYPSPYFDGSFILFLILILLVFGTTFGYGGGCYYGEDK
ncbi:MAG: sporulation protein YjcZ [Bacillota bacterium]